MKNEEYERRVREHEEKGCTRSDAQAIVEAEDLSRKELEVAADAYDVLRDGMLYVRNETARAEALVRRFAAALRDHCEKNCPACRAFERDREERGVRS